MAGEDGRCPLSVSLPRVPDEPAYKSRKRIGDDRGKEWGDREARRGVGVAIETHRDVVAEEERSNYLACACG